MPTSSVDFTKQILWAPEGLTTPGVTPNNYASWKHSGATSIDQDETFAHEEIRVLGINTLYADIIMGKTDTFTLNYYLYDTKLLRQGILFGTGVGSADESISVLEARNLNGTPMFRVYQGAFTTGVTLNIGKVYTVQHSFRAIRISNWLTQAQLDAMIGSTPTYPAALAATPKTNLDARVGPSFADVDPFVLNGVNVDVDSMTVNVGYAIAEKTPLGHFDPKNLKPMNQAITMSYVTWEEGSALLGDMRNFLAQLGTFKLWEDTVDAVLTMNAIKFNNYKTSAEGGGTDFIKETYAATLKSLDIPLM